MAEPSGVGRREERSRRAGRRSPAEESDQRPVELATLTRLFSYTRAHARRRNLLLLLVLTRALQLPLLSWLVARMIGGPVAAGDERGIWLGALALAALVLSTASVLYYRQKLALELGEAVIHDLRAAIVQHLFSMPTEFFHKQRVGRLLGRLTSDLEAVRVGVKDVAFVSTVQLGSMLISAALMLYYDWRLFLVVLTLVPVLSATVRHFQRKLIAAHRKTHESFARVTSTVAESIAGVRVTQSHGRAAINSEAFRSLIEEHADRNIEGADRAAVLLPVLELNGQLFLVLLLVLGGYRALHGELGFEVLVQFFFLSGSFFQPIPVLATQYNQALTAMSGAERVFALLDVTPSWSDPEHARELDAWSGRVELRDVGFAYEPGRPVLQDIDLLVEPGQTVALVGQTGSGKSTLIGLLAKFYLPTAGRILLDGQELRELSTASLRRQIGIVQQQNFLFSGTVLDNIRMARSEASDDEVREAARALDLLETIEAFPHGFHTQLAERGAGLSLGQRQIVCFTRAMLASPRVLLLDEATSAMDGVTELRLQAALVRLLAGRTSFVVAHRLSTIEHADLVLLLADGRIVERGTHRTLLAGNTRYRALHERYYG